MNSRQAWTKAFLIYIWVAVATVLIYYALGIEGAVFWMLAIGGVAIEYSFDVLNSVEDRFDCAHISRQVTTGMKVRWGLLIIILAIALMYCLFNVSAIGALALIVLPSLIIALIYYVLRTINGLFPPDDDVQRDHEVKRVRSEHVDRSDPSEIPPCVKKW